jgi:peptidoglycan hydrolase-like protein with peptidoglycan-binding domain
MDIRAIQKKLNELGYDCGVVDGIKGTQTRESIQNFQMDYGLLIDGIVGAGTKAILEAVDLISIQKKLKQLGYDCNTIGNRDEKTIQAIKDFQAAEGLDSYGTINRVTKEAVEKKEIPKPVTPEATKSQNQNKYDLKSNSGR